jgi:photosystem II stability/assembly factor-like uncharacterized protein
MRKLIRMAVFVVALSLAAIVRSGFCQTWQPTAGPEGGFINGLVVDQSGNLFAASPTTGVFRSTDNGANWMLKSSGIGGQNILDFWLDDLTYNKLYDSLFLNYAGLIWRTTDKGESWVQTSFKDQDGCGPTSIAARSDGVLFAGSSCSGIFRSANNGDNWRQVGQVPQYVTSLGFNSAGYAYAGTPAGVYVSMDDGISWSLIPGSDNFNVTALGVDPFDDHIHVGTMGGDPTYGSTFLYDGGVWIETQASGYDGNNQYWYFYFVTQFAFDGQGTIYISTTQNSGVSRSLNHGRTWEYIGVGRDQQAGAGGIRSVAAVAVHPNGTVFAGSNRDGVFRWTGIGIDWTRLVHGMPAIDVSSLIVARDGAVLAGGDGSGIFRSPDSGGTWTRVNSDLISDIWVVRSMAMNHKGQIFAAWGGVSRSDDGGNTWPSPYDPNSPQLPACCAYALAISQNDVVYAGGGGNVFRSTNDGVTWEILSGMEGADVRSMAIDASGRIFAGVQNNGSYSGIYRSEDQGQTWQQVGFNGTYLVTSIAFNPRGDIFAATNWNIYRSRDHGETWKDIYQGITRALAINNQGRIFAAGDGVVTSVDNGATWQPFDDGLRKRWIFSLTLDKSEYLYAGHWGGGVSKTALATRELRRRQRRSTSGQALAPTPSILRKWQ